MDWLVYICGNRCSQSLWENKTESTTIPGYSYINLPPTNNTLPFLAYNVWLWFVCRRLKLNISYVLLLCFSTITETVQSIQVINGKRMKCITGIWCHGWGILEGSSCYPVIKGRVDSLWKADANRIVAIIRASTII